MQILGVDVDGLIKFADDINIGGVAEGEEDSMYGGI